MRWPWYVIALSGASAFLGVLGSAASYDEHSLRSLEPASAFRRDEGHMPHDHHHDTPQLDLNETEIIEWHGATPPSYFNIDWDEPDTSARRPGLIMAHAVFMSLAFFVALPMGISLRSVKHSAHGAAVISFYALCALGWASGTAYMKLTPDMYEGSKHGTHGWLFLFLAAILTMVDISAGIYRCISYIWSSDKLYFQSFWQVVVLDKAAPLGVEYTNLVQDAEEDEVLRAAKETSYDAYDAESGSSSDDTLTDARPRSPLTSPKGCRQIGTIIFSVLERFLVFAGFFQLVSGIVVYTGGCRASYLNGCLGHMIKGGIFWCYGLISFARFLGIYAEWGWAWNKVPGGAAYSAEFVESLLIFGYGAPNVWMERFGAHPGDPYSSRQIQHISIDLMFCFGGLIGMAIESKMVRKWLASSISTPSNVHEESPRYSGSFNPFPALVIGITGAAMAAHSQHYVFGVQIHILWGRLLLASSVLRCLTYFFLWLSPLKSPLPSRPPTEALASFFLACGALLFVAFVEESVSTAMRRGYDDVMMILNVAVAITCFVFLWIIFIVGFDGWLKARVNSRNATSCSST